MSEIRKPEEAITDEELDQFTKWVEEVMKTMLSVFQRELCKYYLNKKRTPPASDVSVTWEPPINLDGDKPVPTLRIDRGVSS